MPRAAKVSKCSGLLRVALVVSAATVLAVQLSSMASQLSFVSWGKAAARQQVVARSNSAREEELEAYPNLGRVEDLIYESCIVKEGLQQELECLRNWDKLRSFHKASSIECSVDDLKCVVLDVLDRLCAGIDGQDGTILLNKVASAAQAFKKAFNDDWSSAFDAADTDGSGDVDFEELRVALRTVGVGMTEAEVRIIFSAADMNEDGVISREEFSDFLTAAIFAEEPFSTFAASTAPAMKQVDFTDYLHWSTAGRGSSWAGLAALSRVAY